MNKEKILAYIEDLEDKAHTSSEYFKERNELYIENNRLKSNWNELREWVIKLQKLKGINQQGFSWGVAQEVLDKMCELEKRDK